MCLLRFFFQAEDGIRDLVRSRGLGDVYKRQALLLALVIFIIGGIEAQAQKKTIILVRHAEKDISCLLYTSDAADERSSVDLGGRRIIKKKKNRREHRRSRHTRIN